MTRITEVVIRNPGQLAITTTPPPAKKPSSQLTRLPGTTWQHIFQAKGERG